MQKKTDNVSRKDLDFENQVRLWFDFLIQKKQFKIEQETYYMVRFVKMSVYLEIYFECLSYEMYVDIGLSKENIRVNINDILLYKKIISEPFYWQTSTKEGVEKGVRIFSEYIEYHAQEFLNGDVRAFKEIKEYINREKQNIAKLQRDEDITYKAETAWMEKNYAGVVRLYNELGRNLTVVEKRKCDYARENKEIKKRQK